MRAHRRYRGTGGGDRPSRRADGHDDQAAAHPDTKPGPIASPQNGGTPAKPALARRAQMVSYFAEPPPTSDDDEPPPF